MKRPFAALISRILRWTLLSASSSGTSTTSQLWALSSAISKGTSHALTPDPICPITYLREIHVRGKGRRASGPRTRCVFFYLPSAFRFDHRGRCEKNQGVGGCAFDHPRIGFDVIEAVHGSHSVMYHTCGGPSGVCMGHLIAAPPLVIGASIDPTRFAWPADSSCARTSQRLPHCAGH